MGCVFSRPDPGSAKYSARGRESGAETSASSRGESSTPGVKACSNASPDAIGAEIRTPTTNDVDGGGSASDLVALAGNTTRGLAAHWRSGSNESVVSGGSSKSSAGKHGDDEAGGGASVGDDDASALAFINQALANAVLFRELDDETRARVANAMTPLVTPKGHALITEGELGECLFLVRSGTFAVTQRGSDCAVNTKCAGDVFGEIALMFETKRTATVTATADGRVFVLSREVFRTVARQPTRDVTDKKTEPSASVRLKENTEPALRPTTFHLQVDESCKPITLDDATAETVSPTRGDPPQRTTAFGTCSVKTFPLSGIGTARGDETDKFSYADQSEKSVLEKSTYEITLRYGRLLGGGASGTVRRVDLVSKHQLKIGLDESSTKEKPNADTDSVGGGTFGVCDADPALGVVSFALKVRICVSPNPASLFVCLYNTDTCLLQKKRVRKTAVMTTPEHVFCERSVSLEIENRFCMKMHGSFKDERYLYFLLDFVDGCDLMDALAALAAVKSVRDPAKHFAPKIKMLRGMPENVARHYVATVTLALEYLHDNDIVYRDLKPENVLLARDGSAKLGDFGFAKRIKKGTHTFTFCGTPGYVAPEVVLARGYGHSVDWWGLGVMTYVLLTGTQPFSQMVNGSPEDPLIVMKRIVDRSWHVSFPVYVSSEAIDCIRGLLDRRSVKRLGNGTGRANDIKTHGWFQTDPKFDWDGLQSGKHQTAPLEFGEAFYKRRAKRIAQLERDLAGDTRERERETDDRIAEASRVFEDF